MNEDCNTCNNEDYDTLETRQSNEGMLRRRKQCRQCGLRWTTYEIRKERLRYFRELESKLKDLMETIKLS